MSGPERRTVRSVADQNGVPMQVHSVEHAGARVAHIRKARRLTQRALAERAAVSYSTVAKVEQGKMAASPSVLGALARALSVPVTELTGQPYMEELRADQLDGLIQPLREAMDLYDVGADPEVRPRGVDVLSREAEALCAATRRAELRQVAAMLPALITESTTAAHTYGTDQAWRTLASAYRTGHDLAAKFGMTDLCTVALERMGWACRHGSDPAGSAVRQCLRGLVYLRAGDYRTGLRLIDSGMRCAEQAEPGVERDAVTGRLHLGAAVLHARAGEDEADEHLAEAERYAARTGEVQRIRWLCFGPTNVAVHRVSALAERDRYREAVEVADGMSASVLPASRVAHHHAEVARAQLVIGRADDAFASLREARRIAPQQTRLHPLVRETYAGLVAVKRRVPDNVLNYGSWLGR